MSSDNLLAFSPKPLADSPIIANPVARNMSDDFFDYKNSINQYLHTSKYITLNLPIIFLSKEPMTQNIL